ncbi:hypothetical protein INP77_00370 [Methylophilus sp. 13]|uniref:hypothetical protein n=1 Tax=Methylophilus sp. 13 TaxID=2781018 RepID=UPI00188F7183|nr:hypothetical protein [Methylophilus sp. 13]MBF5037935.1 hypothetical protein [Methylophilus sp. 13]
MEKQQSSQWWRWPLLPFASILGGLLGSMLFVFLHWLLMKFQGDFHEDGWWFRYILPTISSGVFGWLYIYITFRVAPKGKVIAGVVMTTILGIFTIFSIVASWYLSSNSMINAIQQTIGALAAFIFAIVGLVQMKDEQERIQSYSQQLLET